MSQNKEKELDRLYDRVDAQNVRIDRQSRLCGTARDRAVIDHRNAELEEMVRFRTELRDRISALK